MHRGEVTCPRSNVTEKRQGWDSNCTLWYQGPHGYDNLQSKGYHNDPLLTQIFKCTEIAQVQLQDEMPDKEFKLWK